MTTLLKQAVIMPRPRAWRQGRAAAPRRGGRAIKSGYRAPQLPGSAQRAGAPCGGIESGGYKRLRSTEVGPYAISDSLLRALGLQVVVADRCAHTNDQLGVLD